MGTSLRIPEVKLLIKDFAKAVHKRKGYVILVNDKNVFTKEWNGIIDYQIKVPAMSGSTRNTLFQQQNLPVRNAQENSFRELLCEKSV
ncbi:DHS-like NAD/FAD-binding domain-containing protein [Gigaspora margarita]|uniref:DHS-like NAD/FAD-binding domain-containing protein n=1 Tax=Gigaspora margarita TaxID=4874 RepID=A0A8H4AEX1_GIGMA|nr:DHS-like NAD/FAD-binding domain-containing protein [Gigaspora margarita]